MERAMNCVGSANSSTANSRDSLERNEQVEKLDQEAAIIGLNKKVCVSMQSHHLLPHLGAHEELHERGEKCRAGIVKFIYSHKVQVLLSVLLIVDLVVVIAELMILDSAKPYGWVSCDEKTNPANTTGRRLLGAVAVEDHSKHDAAGLMPGCTVHAEKQLSHSLHTAEVVLKYTSLAILVIFEVELLFLVYGMGRKFFKTPLLVLDIFVVTVSLIFDLTMANYSEFVLILLLSRLWRFARIFHALGVTVHEMDEKHFEHQLHMHATEEELAGKEKELAEHKTYM